MCLCAMIDMWWWILSLFNIYLKANIFPRDAIPVNQISIIPLSRVKLYNFRMALYVRLQSCIWPVGSLIKGMVYDCFMIVFQQRNTQCTTVSVVSTASWTLFAVHILKHLWNFETDGLRAKLNVYYCYYANCHLTQQAYLGFNGRDEKYY